MLYKSTSIIIHNYILSEHGQSGMFGTIMLCPLYMSIKVVLQYRTIRTVTAISLDRFGVWSPSAWHYYNVHG